MPKEQTYPLKLKGISICFSMLKAALCGSYVNFGVFRLYGDEALDNALNIFVKLLLSIPQADLLVSSINCYCCFIILTFEHFSGLPEIISNLLRPIRMFGTGSYEFSSDSWASGVSLYIILNFRRTHSVRWASKSCYRSVHVRDTARNTKTQCRMIDVNSTSVPKY